jgi:hypothetical protein
VHPVAVAVAVTVVVAVAVALFVTLQKLNLTHITLKDVAFWNETRRNQGKKLFRIVCETVYYTARCHVPKYSVLHGRRRVNRNSYISHSCAHGCLLEHMERVISLSRTQLTLGKQNVCKLTGTRIAQLQDSLMQTLLRLY